MPTPVTDDYYERSQGYGLTRTDADARLRARVYIDSYAEQSHAVAEFFTPERGWVEVYRLMPPVATRRHGEVAWGAPSYASRDDKAKRVTCDQLAADLLAHARPVLRAVTNGHRTDPDALALDALAELVQAQAESDGSGADFIDACTVIVAGVRTIEEA